MENKSLNNIIVGYKLKWSVRLPYWKLLFREISTVQYMYSCTSIHMSTDLELNTTALVAICGHIPCILVGRTKHPKTVDRFCNPAIQLKKVPLTTPLSLMTYDCFTLLSLFTGRNKGRRRIHTQRSCWKLSGHQVSLMVLTPHLPPAMNLVVVRCTYMYCKAQWP